MFTHGSTGKTFLIGYISCAVRQIVDNLSVAKLDPKAHFGLAAPSVMGWYAAVKSKQHESDIVFKMNRALV